MSAKKLPSTATSPPRTSLVALACLLAAVFATTWVVWVPRALQSHHLIGGDWAVSLGVGWTYAPAFAAVAFVAFTGGRRSLADLRRRLLDWRIGWRWFAAIALIPMAIAVSTAIIYAVLGGSFSSAVPAALELPLPLIPVIIAIRALTDGLGEEMAWRGVALPGLLQHMNAVTASLVLGLVWAMWHLPLILTSGSLMANDSIALLFVLLPAEAVVYTWVFRNTNGSVLAAVLFHAIIGLWAIASPLAEATGRPEAIRAGLWVVLAAGLVARHGLSLTGRSAHAPGKPAAAPAPVESTLG
jgi:uncharacterized protein